MRRRTERGWEDDIAVVRKEGTEEEVSKDHISSPWPPATTPPHLQQAPGARALPTLQRAPLREGNGSQEPGGSKTPRLRHVKVMARPLKKRPR